MKRLGTIFAIFNLIGLIVFVAGCHTATSVAPTSAPISQTNTSIQTTGQPTTTVNNAYSRLVATFSGLGDGATDIFVVDKPSWRVEYSCWRRDSAEMMRFSLFIYPANDNLNYIDSVLVITAPQKDNLYESNAIGSYYLKIIGYNSFWTVSIYE